MSTEDSAPLRDEAEPNAEREALRQRLTHLFRRCDLEHGGDSVARVLFKAVLDYRLEALR